MHGAGIDDPILWYEAGVGQTRRLLADALGSIVAVSDQPGNGFAVNRYDEYGVTPTSNFGRFQYTGQLWFAQLGLSYYKARFYNPTLGRFMQTDPVGYDDQINLYAYVGDDPVNSGDPTGMQSIETFTHDDPAEAAAINMPDFPGWAIVSGHGYENGRIQIEGRATIDANLIYERLIDAGYVQGRPVILLNCFAARGNFASRLARLTGGVVYAAGGYVRIPTGPGNHTYESFAGENGTGERSGWTAFNRNGPTGGRRIDSIRVSGNGNTLTIRYQAPTGTRIRPQPDRLERVQGGGDK